MTRLPGAEQPRMEPVLGQYTVISLPSSVVTSARNRLYRLISVAGWRGVSNSMDQRKWIFISIMFNL